jgi:hypothetical protein
MGKSLFAFLRVFVFTFFCVSRTLYEARDVKDFVSLQKV